MENKTKQIIEIETELIQAYADEFGLGSMEYRAVKAFLLSPGRRKSERAVMVRNFEYGIHKSINNEAPELPKNTIDGQPGQVPPSKLLPPESPSLSPGEGEGVAEVNITFDMFKHDISKGLNVVSLAKKYNKDQLIEYAKATGAKIKEGATEKQIVSIIIKQLKPID